MKRHGLRLPWKFTAIGEVATIIPASAPDLRVGAHRSARGRHRVGLQIAGLTVTLHQAEAYRLADLLVDTADQIPTPTENTPTPPKGTSNE